MTGAGIDYSEKHRAWIVDGHEEFLSAARSPALEIPKLGLPPAFLETADPAAVALVHEQAGHVLLYTSGATHRRRRRALLRPFSRQAVDARRAAVRDTVGALLDEARAAGGIEVVDGLARPLLSRVLADVVGVPPGRRPEFDSWSRAVTDSGQAGPQTGSVAVLTRAARAVEAIEGLVREALWSPATLPPGSVLAHAASEAGRPGALTPAELAANVRSLYSSGVETTLYLLASVASMVFSRPPVLRDLRADPSHAAAAVRETLRFACPAVELPVRRANRDTRICGRTIAEGDWVRLVALKAERDPRRFSRPDEFDHHRTDHKEILAYGLGPHICLGKYLASAVAEECVKVMADSRYNARIRSPLPAFRLHPALPVALGPPWVHLELT